MRRLARWTGRGLLAGALALPAAGCGGPSYPGTARTTTTGAPASTAPTSTTTTAPGRAPGPGAEGVPAFSHVFVVVMENLGASAAMSVPSIAALAHRYQYTTNWYAAGHPSLPNYLALVSGSTWGITSDCTACYVSGPYLGAQLTGAGVSWGAYFEAMPSPCFLGPQSPDGLYAQKHDPFAYFTDVRHDPSACAHLQPLTRLGPLLAGPASAVPRFVWVTPDLCHDGHDCPAATAGAWLQSFVAEVTASSAWSGGGVLFVTWDEGDDSGGVDPATGKLGSGGGGAVLGLVIAPGRPAGRALAGPFTHYGLLRTVEDAFGLAHLGAAGEPGATPLSAFFSS